MSNDLKIRDGMRNFFFNYKSLKFGSRNICSTIYGVFGIECVANMVYKLFLREGSLAADMS